MDRPWMKFYPADWRADPALRMCSIAARGLWFEMLCIMHSAEPYGHLVVNGKAVNEKQLSGLVGSNLREVSPLLRELRDAGVFDLEDDVIVSRRMVRDFNKALTDKENGKSGGNPRLKGGVARGVNPPDKGEDKAHIPEARSQIPEEESSLRSEARVGAGASGFSADEQRLAAATVLAEMPPPRSAVIRAEFDRDFWPVYPHKVGKPVALKAFEKARRSHELSAILAGLSSYIASKPADRSWLNPATFLNAERFADEPAAVLQFDRGGQRAPPVPAGINPFLPPHKQFQRPTLSLDEARARAERFHELEKQGLI